MKYNLALMFVVLYSFCCFSQQEGIYNEYGSEILNSDSNLVNVLNTVALTQINSIENSVSNQGNDLIIRQIGDYNRVFSQNQSSSSNLKLSQYGNYNEIDLIINAPSIKGSILQNGNNNSVLDNIYYTNQNVEMNVIQNGNNLSLNRIGVNSLTNKLQLVQEGSFKTITIISK
ncbi:MAG: hypothetical protein HKO81_05940 [Flavobacteriaceae bacterium]|nr:hypothetical protein [Flavobacteriaceae bacterium]